MGGQGGPNVMASMQGLGKPSAGPGGYQPKMFGVKPGGPISAGEMDPGSS